MTTRHVEERRERWNKAVQTFEGGDRAGALYLFKSFAQEGSLDALAEIGNIYELGGGGVEQDFDKAKHWYELSIAKANSAAAHVGLARLYYMGLGVTKDYEKAFDLLSKVETEQRPGVLYLLAHMYEFGIGVHRDHDKAFALYSTASALGHLIALRSLGRMEIRRGEVFIGLATWLKAAWKIIRVALRDPEDVRLKVC